MTATATPGVATLTFEDRAQLLVNDVLEQHCFAAVGTTRRGYRTVLLKFLRRVERLDHFTAQDVRSYFRQELEEGRSRGYCRWQFNALKLLFAYLETPFPVERRIIPTPREGDMRIPALLPVEMAQAIRAAHSSLLDPLQTAYLCACTVWGFRRMELGSMSLDKGMVQVEKAKTGGYRVHSIPEVLWAALSGYQPLPATQVGEMFTAIRKLASLSPRAGLGWHSIRRAVTTGLWEAGLDQPTLNAYMGWSSVGSSSSAMRYYRPRPQEVDERVYARHPFLPLWSVG